jgi:hypothetical protein
VTSINASRNFTLPDTSIESGDTKIVSVLKTVNLSYAQAFFNLKYLNKFFTRYKSWRLPGNGLPIKNKLTEKSLSKNHIDSWRN